MKLISNLSFWVVCSVFFVVTIIGIFYLGALSVGIPFNILFLISTMLVSLCSFVLCFSIHLKLTSEERFVKRGNNDE